MSRIFGLPSSGKKMSFSPLEADDDDLSLAIEQQNQGDDDRWQLKEDIDPDRLQHFWDDALRDLGSEASNAE